MIHYKYLDGIFINNIKDHVFNTLIISKSETYDIMYGDIIQFYDNNIFCMVVVGACRKYDNMDICMTLENGILLDNSNSRIKRNIIGNILDVCSDIIALDIIEL